MSFLKRVSHEEIQFNGTEKRIIEFCIQNSSKVTKMRIADLATELFVSPNTIIRLSKKLGYRGFSEMKYDMSDNVIERDTRGEENEPQDVINMLQRTEELMNQDVLERIIESLEVSGKICIFAAGLTRYATMPFMTKMQYLNKLVLLSDDRDSSRLLAANLEAKDIAIFVSLSAKTTSLIESYHVALKSEATIFSITGLGQSKLNTTSNSLYVYVQQRFIQDIDFTSRIPVEYVFERIFNAYFEKITNKI